MKETFLLRSEDAERLYNEAARDLPIVDFHNHLSVADIAADRKYENVYELWLATDPYKHRLMRISGVEEYYITGDAAPREKFEQFCRVFPYLAGNPVYDWSRMELARVLGIDAVPSEQTAARIWDETSERLRSPEFSTRGILKRFNIEYQSPVATLTDDLSPFDGVTVAPSLRADDLLSPTEVLKHRLAELSGIKITDIDSYMRAVAVMLDKFNAVGCRFADHSLDAGFFRDDEGGDEREMLTRLGCEYNRRGWTLLLHVGAKRKTSPRLARLAGPAGGYAAVGEGFELSSLVDTLGDMERRSGLPDTVLFPLNASDHAAVAVMQGAFSEDGVRSKVQLGPAWWWCDHEMGIRSVLDSVASYGAVAHFIGMTTDSRSILSFARHDYFRRILCSWLAERNATGEWEMPYEVEKKIIEKICYANAKEKIKGDRTK